MVGLWSSRRKRHQRGLPLHHFSLHSQKKGHPRTVWDGDRLQARKRSLTRNQPCRPPDLRLPAPRAVRSRCLLCKPPDSGFCYESLRWLMKHFFPVSHHLRQQKTCWTFYSTIIRVPFPQVFVTLFSVFFKLHRELPPDLGCPPTLSWVLHVLVSSHMKAFQDFARILLKALVASILHCPKASVHF